MTIDYSFFAIVIHFYTWILVSLLILIMAAIGLFYQRKFQYRTRYYLFFISLILTLGEILHIVSTEYKMIEFIEMLGILTAALLCIQLYQKMTEAT
jgi:hypothetical protein